MWCKWLANKFGPSGLKKMLNKGHYYIAKHDTDLDFCNYVTADNVNAADNEDWAPLHSATCFSKIECMKHCLRLGAKVDAWFGRNGVTPLMLAARNDYIEAIHLLLEAGANVEDARTTEQPIWYAYVNHKVRAWKVLIDYGSPVAVRYPDNDVLDFIKERNRCRNSSILIMTLHRLRRPELTSKQDRFILEFIAKQMWSNRINL